MCQQFPYHAFCCSAGKLISFKSVSLEAAEVKRRLGSFVNRLQTVDNCKCHHKRARAFFSGKIIWRIDFRIEILPKNPPRKCVSFLKLSIVRKKQKTNVVNEACAHIASGPPISRNYPPKESASHRALRQQQTSKLHNFTDPDKKHSGFRNRSAGNTNVSRKKGTT